MSEDFTYLQSKLKTILNSVEIWESTGLTRANSIRMYVRDLQDEYATPSQPSEVPAVAVQAEPMRAALQTIADWVLPETGEVWPSGEPISYTANHGSNGAREYMRKVAREALAAHPEPAAPSAVQEDLCDLLREARDNAIASTAEDDISADRRAYRRELAERLNTARQALRSGASAQPVGYRVFKDGSQWCAVGPGFIDLQQSPAGFADTPGEALKQLMKEFGKEWAAKNGEWVKAARAAQPVGAAPVQPLGYLHNNGKFHAIMPAWEPEAAAPVRAVEQPTYTTGTAIGDVLLERARQDAQWGGPAHDDTHYGKDWRHYIRKQLAEMNDTDYKARRERFIKIAALAVAAVESIDRATPKEAQP